jgi:N-methylhydantoinase A
VTDANLVLGYLDPERFGSGSLKLDAQAARRALDEQIARPLAVDVGQAAWAIHQAANASLASAIHVVTVQRGLDPRDHTLIGFGGAGPMHMAGVAQLFGIRHAIVPPKAGVAAAVGMQGSDLRIEYGRSQLLRPAELTLAQARKRFAELEASALERMGYAEAPAELEVERLVDARFEGQAHELSVPLGSLDEAGLAALDAAFRERYRAAYGIEAQGTIEFAALRVRLRIPVIAPPLPRAASSGDAVPRMHRSARFGERIVDAAVYDRIGLAAGVVLEGPAILESHVETIVLPPGWTARVDPAGSILLELQS